jgi:hypothetical protein
MSELTFASLTIEARTEVIKEAMESTAWALEKSEKELEFLRLRLEEQKAALGHGNWLPWIKETFGGDDSAVRKIQRFLQKPNTTVLTYLPDDSKPPIVPRAERKTGRVEVHKVGQTVVQADPANQAKDDDPNPAPKTNTLHKPATAKAKEADRPVPAVVTPEIVDEPEPVAVDPVQEWIRSHSLGDLVSAVVDQLEGDVAKRKAAAELRKLADKLDPPKTDKTPSKSQLIAMIPDDWAPELQRAAADWAEYKQARAKGERIQTVRAWELALEQFTTLPSKEVISKVNKAIENSWKGWNHDSKTGNGNGNGKVTTGRIKPTADEPKITYV